MAYMVLIAVILLVALLIRAVDYEVETDLSEARREWAQSAEKLLDEQERVIDAMKEQQRESKRLIEVQRQRIRELEEKKRGLEKRIGELEQAKE